MQTEKPDFDSIKSFEEFKKYRWTRNELSAICKERGLLYIGTDKKLEKVIEAYFNGERIPPRRDWYSNKVLNGFVNENGMLIFNFCLFGFNLILILTGIINAVRGTDNLYYVLPFSFGGAGLIFAIVGIQAGRDLEVIKSYGPMCGDRRFKRSQVDEQANSPDTVYLSYSGVFLAPDMVIGSSAGVCAIAYEDIDRLRIKQSKHSERIGPRGSTRYREYFTYKIIVRTKKGKRIAISKTNGEPEGDIKAIHEQCLKYNPQVKLLDMRRSPLADDPAPKQITEDKTLRKKVAAAVYEQQLKQIFVSGDLREEFIRFHKRTALILIPESLLVGAIAGAVLYLCIRFLHRPWLPMALVIWLLFPFYAVYCFFKTLVLIRKDDITFYSGKVIRKSEKGFAVEGLDYRFLGYIKKLKPVKDPEIGDRVILARLGDEYSLIAESRDESHED